MSRGNPITQALILGVQEGIFPGAVLFARVKNSILYHEAIGLTSSLPSGIPVRLDTLYDLASLTKPLATTSAVLCLVQDGLAHLNQTVGSILTQMINSPVGGATIRDLLGHRSGLPAWRPYYEQFGFEDGKWRKPDTLKHRRDFLLDQISQEPLAYQPESPALYSDLGFMLLGFVIEGLAHQSFSGYCQERVFNPLGARSLTFFQDGGGVRYGNEPALDTAPTEYDPWRGRLLQGEVHDENAFLLNGMAGHAGLFGTTEAVAAITGAWLQGYRENKGFFPQKIVREFLTKQPGSSWALGWDTPSPPSSSGRRLSPEAFGHLGFTGTSIWIDPIPELEIILLTNRVYPTRDNNKIKDFRPMIHDVVFEELIGKA